MSLKYSSTTADYLIWSDAMNLIRKLAKDENYKISLLIALGCFTGLRISDILSLRWKQILGADKFTVIEKKTGKVRTIRLNPQLQEHIKECYEHINPIGINAPILISQKGTIFTVQRINIILKEVKKKYRLKIKNFSFINPCGYQFLKFTSYKGNFHFDTHMDLQSLDANLIKFPIQNMFEGRKATIYPHSMLINLEPFVIFAPIPMN